MAKEKKQKKTVKAKATTKKTASSTKKIIKKTTPAKATAKTPAKATKADKKQAPKAVKPAKKQVKKPKREDTGSVEFQISNFTQKIKLLNKHLKSHAHDFDSRRGLLIMVGKRRRLLNYLKKNDPQEYEKAVKLLKLKA